MIRSIANKYKIAGVTPDEIRTEIRKEVASLHPDKSGGSFKTSEAEARYHELQKAKDEIDEIEIASQSLVSVSAIHDLVKRMTSRELVDTKGAYERRLETAIKDMKFKNSRKGFVPKVGITAITAVLTFLWLFPKTVSDHPVLKNYVDVSNSEFTLFWFLSVFLCSSLWLSLYMNGQIRAEALANLKLEQSQNELFEIFIEAASKRSDYLDGHVNLRFTKADFISFLTSDEWRDVARGLPKYKVHSLRGLSTLGGGARIDPELATSLADLIFARAEGNGIIATSGERALSTRYKLVQSIHS